MSSSENDIEQSEQPEEIEVPVKKRNARGAAKIKVTEEDEITAQENDSIDKEISETAAAEPKKKPRTAAQIEAMRKAQQIRTENLKRMGQKERSSNEKEIKRLEAERKKLEKQHLEERALKIAEEMRTREKIEKEQKLREKREKAKMKEAQKQKELAKKLIETEPAIQTEQPRTVRVTFDDPYMALFG